MPFPSQRSPIPPGQRLAGKYRIEREIGAGAMGVVVEAWHVELDQSVAIKFLNQEFASNEEVAERFRREARAAVRIESEHVARVIDIGVIEESGTPYYVMELLRGNDLARELEEQGPLPPSVAVDYALQACQALVEAHAKGIVHRDLKPANLFLAQRPNGGRIIKVLDFGISKFMSATARHFSLTNTATLMGSPAYMSPEQLESTRNVDERADIWSLGVILHELISGQIPFRGESVLQLVRAILTGARTPLTTRSEVPQGLEDVVVRCLQQDRELRYSTIEQLREALLPFSSSAMSGLLVSTARGVAPDMRPKSSQPARSGGSQPASGAPAEPHARSASTSWGHTQRGRAWHTVYRRGLPSALLALLLLGGYFVIRPWLGDSGPGPAPLPPAAPVAEAKPETLQPTPPTGSGLVPAAQPPIQVLPAPVSTESVKPEAVPAPAASAPKPTVGAGTSGVRSSVPSAPLTKRETKAQSVPATANEARERPAEHLPSSGVPASPPAADAPANQTPTRRPLDMPDYGGRE
jgi:eukaryotic-like serine/threonine-protein kinase